MRHTRRGFTLIELMMTVAIIGLLAAVAVPSFIRYQVRSRQAERSVVSRAIHEAVTILFIREGGFPTDLGGGGTKIDCPENPAGAPTTYKRQFDPNAGDWGKLSMSIEGAVYYTYLLTGEAAPGGRWHIITTEGDLDGDGVPSTQARTYIYASGGLIALDEVNAGGEF